jgi:tape measure domain-containing protein
VSEQVGAIHYDVSADTSKLLSESAKAKTWLDRLTSVFGKTEAAAAKNERQLTQTAQAVKQLGQNAQQVNATWSTLTRLMTAVVTARAVQAVIQMSDQYGQMASRIRNATSSTDEYEMVQARLLKTANGTYRSLAEAQEVYLSTADTLRDLGYTTAQVLDISDSLSYAFVRDAARADQATTAMDAYSKALMKGKIDADGWASIMAATPSIVKGVAVATGETEAKIKQLGATGKLSIKALNEGLRQSLDENKKMADAMTVSVADAGTKLRNALTVFIGKVNESSGASKGLTDNVALLADALQDPETIKAAQDLAGGIVASFSSIVAATRDVVGAVQWMQEQIKKISGDTGAEKVLTMNLPEMVTNLIGRWKAALGMGKSAAGEIDQAGRDALRRMEAGYVPYSPEASGKPKKVNAEAPSDADAKKAGKAATKLREDAAQAEADAEEMAAQDAAEAWDFFYKSVAAQQEARTEATKQQWQQVFDEIDAEQDRAIAEGQAFLDAQEQVRKNGTEVAGDLALVFSSAAGEAIMRWESVGDVLKGILADLAQIAIRETVTKPLTGVLTGALKGFDITKLFSFLPQAATGMDYVPQDMPVMVHKGERIVPAAENLRDRSAGSGRPGGIVLTSAPNIRIDARTDVGAVAQMVAQGMRVANEQMLMQLKASGVMG